MSSPSLAGGVGLQLQRMNAGHERSERPVDHLMALDQRAAGETGTAHVDREVIAAAGVILGVDLRLGKRFREAALDLVRVHWALSYTTPPSTSKHAPALAW